MLCIYIKNNQTRSGGRHRRLRLIAPTTYELMEKNDTCLATYFLCCKNDPMKQCMFFCPKGVTDKFIDYITWQLWRVYEQLLVNALLAGVIVGIGAYGHRYRHYGFTRYLLLGATTLFLPIISYVLSAAGSTDNLFNVTINNELGDLTAKCRTRFFHRYVVIVSTCLVLISAINTSPIVATDDREDRSILPPFELLLQGIWIVYLAVSTRISESSRDKHLYYIRLSIPFALIHAKMALKYYAFLKARKSYALGRNPRLIVGYMQQLQEGSDQNGKPLAASDDDMNVPPPLVVMGEDKLHVEKQPHGYMFIKNLEAIQGGGLVTIDKVWQLQNMSLTPMPQRLKDICLSFALFKLLRCRFARYKVTDGISAETSKFIRSELMKDGQHGRALRTIADELSFLHDYYDSPLPVSCSDKWLIMISMVISFLGIGYYIFTGSIIYSHP
ncbi:uncharacterized protein [Triticum aestivum]|uniref:uncharacterized protein n=1 Tax=Triticum aestivum TaxID=4565 RepID=UPI001D0334BB|nr:uncharacterized protein LOC123139547 [Triticum aestivum]